MTLTDSFIQKIQLYYSNPSPEIFFELNEYQQQDDAWNCVQYLNDQNPYLKSFATSTIKFKCKFSLSTLGVDDQLQLLNQLCHIQCLDGAALILKQKVEWLDQCPDLSSVLSECALIDDFPPIQLSKYLPMLAQHPLGLDTIGRLLHKSTIALDLLMPFVDTAISVNNFHFLTEIAAIYFNSPILLRCLSDFCCSVDYQALEELEQLDFIYLCAELGESNITLLINKVTEYPHYWELMIKLSGLPTMHLLLFWTYISERIHKESYDRTAFVYIYKKLTDTIVKSITYPDVPTTDKSELEDFKQHRREASEVLSFCCHELQDDFFAILLSNPNSNYQIVEVKYFCVRSVGYELQSYSNYPNLHNLLHLQSDYASHPAVIYAKCLTTQTLSLYYKKDKNWTDTALRWIEDCALILNTHPQYINAVLRSLSFLMQDLNGELKVQNEMMRNCFQLAWDLKHKEALSNFCRCAKYLMADKEFNLYITGVLQEMMAQVQSPMCLLFLSLFIQHVEDPCCLLIVQQVLGTPNMPTNAYLAKFYKAAPKHATTINDMISLTTQLMGLPVFQGQLHALEVVVQGGYGKLDKDNQNGAPDNDLVTQWNTLVSSLFQHLLTNPVDESELENLTDFLQMLYHCHYEIYFSCNQEILYNFISKAIPMYMESTEIPENIGNMILWLLCLVEILDPTVTDLQHQTYKNKWHNVQFPDGLRHSIYKGISEILPCLVFVSNMSKFPTIHLRDLGVILIIIIKNSIAQGDVESLLNGFNGYYSEKSPSQGYKTQMGIFGKEMIGKGVEDAQQGIQDGDENEKKRALRRGVTSILGVLRVQKQWYSTVTQ